jgi:hypothetical protein
MGERNRTFWCGSAASAAFRNIVFSCRRGKTISIYDVVAILFKGHVNGEKAYSFQDFEDNRDRRFDQMSLTKYKQLNARAFKHMQERDAVG